MVQLISTEADFRTFMIAQLFNFDLRLLKWTQIHPVGHEPRELAYLF